MNRFFRRKFLQIVIRLLLLTVIVALSFGIYSIFEIRNIIVEPASVKLELDTKRYSNNLLLIRVDTLQEIIEKSNPNILKVSFDKIFPSTLKIVITMRTPVAQIRTQGGVVFIDENNIIFEGELQENLPLLDMPLEQFELGKKINDPKIVNALAFIAQLRHDEAIKVVKLNSENTLVIQFTDFEVMIPVLGEMSQKAHTLQTILKGFRMKGTVPTRIDLRFEKPIIESR